MNPLYYTTTVFFRQRAAAHNVTHGRYPSWADARVMWKLARTQARIYLAR
jgi:hypothetical protein